MTVTITNEASRMHTNSVQVADNTNSPRVILDKNFIQGESRSARRLNLLHEAGAVFVLTDTLVYEFASNDNIEGWKVAQKKLFAFSERIECWHHIDELLTLEAKQGSPLVSPIDWDTTNRVRKWFASGKPYIPENIRKLADPVKKVRELLNTNHLIDEARQLFGDGEREDSASLKMILEAYHGDASNDHYIEDSPTRVTSDWFAHHHAIALLAFYRLVIRKYGSDLEYGQHFPNTKLDLDYVSLLHFADSFATNETRGDMKELLDRCRNSKLTFTHSDTDRAEPKEDEIKALSYELWRSSGSSHGHHTENWLNARSRLMHHFWDRLSNRTQ